MSLFLAPASYSLRDYLSWPETGLIESQQQQAAYLRIKTYPTIDYTWGYGWAAGTTASTGAGSNGRMLQVRRLHKRQAIVI